MCVCGGGGGEGGGGSHVCHTYLYVCHKPCIYMCVISRVSYISICVGGGGEGGRGLCYKRIEI